MILRTPPLKKPRADSIPPESPLPDSDGHLVVYESPAAQLLESSQPLGESEQMLCTYQCRQMVKSDFLDTLGSTEMLVKDYESKFQTLTEKLQRTEFEAQKYRDQFQYAEQELAAAKGRELALQGQLLKEVKDSQEQLKKQMQLCNELEVKNQKEMNLRMTAESSAASAKDKASILEKKLANLQDLIEGEKLRFKDDLTQFKRESTLSCSRIRANLEKMECRAQSAEKEAQLLREQLLELNKQYDRCLHQNTELEKKLLSFTCPSLETHHKESNVLMKHLQEELRNYEFEVREARKLKASFENTELLKERFAEEKGRRERAEAEVLKLLEGEKGMKALEDELISLKSTIKNIPGVSDAEDIPLKISALQKEAIIGMEKVGEANARLKQIEVALETAELGKRKAETEAKSAIAQADSLKSENQRLQSMLSSATEETDHLRKSYLESRKQEKVVCGDGNVNRNLIQELESSLTKKDSCIKELETCINEQKAANIRLYSEINLLNDKISCEAKKIKSLDREGDRLRSEIRLLESKLGNGDYSASNTKVLRMVNTLGVDGEAQQAIEALQSELHKANEKLQVVEELKRQSADSGKLVDSYIAGKIVQLKDQIATLEKREERYKTVFADRISVFRRACCELFGYKIVMDDQLRSNGIPVTHFILQSIYAQNDEEKLEFEYESGNTKILVNDYTSRPDVSQQVKIFIGKMNSIPAFTANLTVESFNRRTLS